MTALEVRFKSAKPLSGSKLMAGAISDATSDSWLRVSLPMREQDPWWWWIILGKYVTTLWCLNIFLLWTVPGLFWGKYIISSQIPHNNKERNITASSNMDFCGWLVSSHFHSALDTFPEFVVDKIPSSCGWADFYNACLVKYRFYRDSQRYHKQFILVKIICSRQNLSEVQ